VESTDEEAREAVLTVPPFHLLNKGRWLQQSSFILKCSRTGHNNEDEHSIEQLSFQPEA
jgi:hypothetical protein